MIVIIEILFCDDSTKHIMNNGRRQFILVWIYKLFTLPIPLNDQIRQSVGAVWLFLSQNHIILQNDFIVVIFRDVTIVIITHY